MRVDFYQLTRDPAPAASAMLARKTLEAGERLLVVAADAALLEEIGTTLWATAPERFLAHGRAGGPHDARQPILLSDTADPANGARFVLLADGEWREPDAGCARVLYLFDEPGKQAARVCWSTLGKRAGIERRYWRQDESGRWVEGP